MDGLVEELLRLESAKHKALVEIDASSYDSNVREQLRLLAASRKIRGLTPELMSRGQTPNFQAPNLERLLALSQLITLNTRLLQNLVSTTPWFAFSGNAYTAKGKVAPARVTHRVAVEA